MSTNPLWTRVLDSQCLIAAAVLNVLSTPYVLQVQRRSQSPPLLSLVDTVLSTSPDRTRLPCVQTALGIHSGWLRWDDEMWVR
jgi:hypothetical protein